MGGPKYDSPPNRQRLQVAASIAAKHGVTANQVALAFLVAHPFPVFPIVGTSNPDRIPAIVAAASTNLSQQELAQLTPQAGS